MKIEVTDHALIRYLERIIGHDIEAIRDEIRAIVQPAIALKATTYSYQRQTFILRGNAVVTITSNSSPSQFHRSSMKLAGYKLKVRR